MNTPRDVLIVEDDLDIRDAITCVLEDFGLVVDCADNGAAALSMMLEAPPRVVLLDTVMPQMSGDAVVEAMHAHPALASIPVVRMTGSVKRADCLRKPFLVPDLISVLAPHLQFLQA